MATEQACSVSARPAGFPDWMDHFEDLVDREPATGTRLLVDGCFDDLLCMPSDFECDEVVSLKDMRQSRKRQTRIMREAQGGHFIVHPLFAHLGLDYYCRPNSEIRGLVELVLDNAVGPIYRLKRRFDRLRPWNVCDPDELAPMFPKGRRYFPGHASFPSGHATVTRLFADLLSERFPREKRKLRKIARGISYRREIAGVHFPSDSQAGRALGAAMARRMLDVDGAPTQELRQRRQALADRFDAL